jgi:predicted DNA-binding transcriptional regulator
MDGIWQMVGFGVGVMAFVLVLQLLDLPEWIGTYLKHRTPRKELEGKVNELQKRVAELEQKIKS